MSTSAALQKYQRGKAARESALLSELAINRLAKRKHIEDWIAGIIHDGANESSAYTPPSNPTSPSSLASNFNAPSSICKAGFKSRPPVLVKSWTLRQIQSILYSTSPSSGPPRAVPPQKA